MTALVCTPAPKATESLWGYVLRLAEENGYDTPSAVLVHAGLEKVRGKAARFDPAALAPLVNRPVEELMHMSYTVPSTLDFPPFQVLGRPAGATLRHSLLNLRAPAFCPNCVADDGFLDAFWDIRYVVACPRHRCALLRACSSCGEAVSWLRRGLLTCRCGHDLSKECTTTVTTAVAELMEVLLCKLHGKSLQELLNQSRYPLEEFESIELWPIVMMCRALVKSSRTENDITREPEPEQVIQYAAKALSDWPHNYHALLHKVGTEIGDVPLYKAGLNARFQRFHNSMFKHRPYASQYDFLRKEYLRFGCQTWGASIVDARSLEGTHHDRRFVSQTELAKQLGITRATVTAWVKNGYLTLKQVQTEKAKRYIADKNEVVIPKRAPGRTLGIRDAAAFVGLPKDVLVELRKSGYYSVSHLPSRMKAFHEKDLERFREQLLIRAPLLAADTGQTFAEAVTMLKLMNHMKFFPAAERSQFIGQYLAGTIRPLGRTTESVRDILFDAETVCNFVLQYKAIGLSYADAARVLGCKEAAVPKLVKDGFLDQVVLDKPRPRVTQASIERFKTTHVFLSAVAEELGTCVSRLNRLAGSAQIEYFRAGGDWQAKGGSPFVRREDLVRLKVEAKRTENRTLKARVLRGNA